MTLPGMPAAVGDPGVFACGPHDIAPWESAPARTQPRAGAAAAPRRTWLVLALCLDCNARTGVYCREHRATNWWLTNWGGTTRGKENATSSTA